MKTELLKSYKLDEVFASSEKEIHSRRKFIKLFAGSTAGIVLPMSTVSQANDDILGFLIRRFAEEIVKNIIEAEISRLSMSREYVYSENPTSGSFYLTNSTNDRAEGNMKLSLVDEWDYSEFSSMSIQYSVPPNTIQQYTFTDGPSAIVQQDTSAKLTATIKENKQSSNIFTIRA